MAEERHGGQNMEFLSKAIVDAITKSPEVRKAIKQLTERDENYSKSFMVLMLKVRNIAESLGVEIAQGAEDTQGEEMFDLNFMSRKKEEKKETMDLTDIVDGRKETPSELAFREFDSSRFNQEEWLKKHGLIF